jgi:hypothetical protein
MSTNVIFLATNPVQAGHKHERNKLNVASLQRDLQLHAWLFANQASYGVMSLLFCFNIPV